MSVKNTSHNVKKILDTKNIVNYGRKGIQKSSKMSRLGSKIKINQVLSVGKERSYDLVDGIVEKNTANGANIRETIKVVSESNDVSEDNDKISNYQIASINARLRATQNNITTQLNSHYSIIKLSSKKTLKTPDSKTDSNMVVSNDMQNQLPEWVTPPIPSVKMPGPSVEYVCRTQAEFKVLAIKNAVSQSPTKKGYSTYSIKADIPSSKGKKRKMFTVTTTASGRVLRKTQWCEKCVGCTTPNCLKCINCLDMKRYGGPGMKKKPCLQRKCYNPHLSIQSAIKASESLETIQDTMSTAQMKNQQQHEPVATQSSQTGRELEEFHSSAESSVIQGSDISKGIIRKARLNLNKKTLQKNRNPVSLQRLIPTSDENVVDGKCAFCDLSEGTLSRMFGVVCCNICCNFVSSNSQGATDVLKCSKSKPDETKLSPEKPNSCIIFGTFIEDRCPACWLACILSKCLMPNLLHDRLRKRLPQQLKENIPTSLARSVSNSGNSGSHETQACDQSLTIGSIQSRPLTDSGSHSVFGSLVDLPGGWRRRTQHSQVIVISPCGEKFRTIPKLEEFLKKSGIDIEASFLFGNSVTSTANTEQASSSSSTEQCLSTDNYDNGQKNKVVMTKLPGGWIRRIKWHRCGDRFDTYVYSPDGRTFRAKRELKNYFVEIGKFDNILKYFPVGTGNSSSDRSSSEHNESSGTGPVQGSSSELVSSSELGSETSSDDKVSGISDNDLDSTKIADKFLTPSSKASLNMQSKQNRNSALRMLKLPSEDLFIDINEDLDFVKSHDVPKNEIKNKRRYRSLPPSRKLCDEPGMTDTTEIESEKINTDIDNESLHAETTEIGENESIIMSPVRIRKHGEIAPGVTDTTESESKKISTSPHQKYFPKNKTRTRNISKFDSRHNDIENITEKTLIKEDHTDINRENLPVETTEIGEKKQGKIVLKIKHQSLNKRKASNQDQLFSHKKNRTSDVISFKADNSGNNNSSRENSSDKIDSSNLKSELIISGELVRNSSREKIETSDSGSCYGFEKGSMNNDSSADDEQEIGKAQIHVDDKSISNIGFTAIGTIDVIPEVDESTCNDGLEVVMQNSDDSTPISNQTEKLTHLTDKTVSPKFREPKSIKDTGSSDDSKLSSPIISESDNLSDSERKLKHKSGKTKRRSKWVTQPFGNGWTRKIKWNENGTGRISLLHSPDGQTFRSRSELMGYFKKAGRSKVDIDFYFPPLILRDEVSSESGIEMVRSNRLKIKDKLISGAEMRKGDEAVSEGSELSENDNTSVKENSRTPKNKIKTRSGQSIIQISTKKTGLTPDSKSDSNMVLSNDVQKQLSELGTRAGKVLVVRSGKGISAIQAQRIKEQFTVVTPTLPSLETPGPRVKHVCRSATQVLGIPRAVFPSPTKEGSSAGYVKVDIPSGKGKKRKVVKVTTNASGKVLRKTQWCGKCVGCNTPNCLKCINCLDMKKYGGPGTKKKPCS